jgi:hypothetical protein
MMTIHEKIEWVNRRLCANPRPRDWKSGGSEEVFCALHHFSLDCQIRPAYIGFALRCSKADRKFIGQPDVAADGMRAAPGRSNQELRQ